MDLTPETLRSATFRDKLRGYHPDDVDDFLESVARGLEILLARLREATEKARAAAPVVERSPHSDEAVKTLALAQRTADLAIHEAKAEAERLVKAAEQKARRVVTDADESAAQLAEAAQAELRADLERLQSARDQLVGEVQALGSWLETERGRIRRALVELAERVDNVPSAGEAPVSKQVSVPTPPRQKLENERAQNAPVTPPKRSEPAEPAVEHARAVISPPVDRPKASVPPGAPAPNPRSTPPRGQPPVRTTGDDAVFSRAQEAIAPTPPASDEDDDPFFRELRAAMLDQSPLGPRDDDDNGGSPAS